jgi:hypothetical protein
MAAGPEDGGVREAEEYNLIPEQSRTRNLVEGQPETDSDNGKEDFSEQIDAFLDGQETDDYAEAQRVSDGGENLEVGIEEDFWKLYDLGRRLEDHYEETGEFWMFQVSDGALDPVVYISDDEAVVHPDFTSEDGFMVEGTQGHHPTALIQNSDYDDQLKRLAGYDKEEIAYTPRLDLRFDDLEPSDRIEGSLVAPGLTDNYRAAAREDIDRYFSS